MNIKKTINKSYTNCSFVSFFTLSLECADNFSVSLCSAGASIRQILCPFPDGSLQNIALSFSDSCEYFGNPLYAGATLSPCAGRISRGRLPIHDHIYELTRNENGIHTLHGGASNGSFMNWELLQEECSDTQAHIVFGCTLPDGLDGFPGNKTIKAAYTLTEDHRLTVEYEGVSDRDTWFNISNHSYFNLTGNFEQSAYDHELQIPADRYICNAPDFIPEDTASADNSPFDFRQKKSLASQAAAYSDNIQLAANQGYNHGFIFPDNADDSQPKLVCTAPKSPVTLTVFSDAPCMVLYSGGYIPDGLQLSGGQKSCPSCALAFEFQDYPDAPGGHGFPYIVSPAGETWKRKICYQFSY